MNAPSGADAGTSVGVADDLELARLLRHEGRGLADRLAGRDGSWWAGPAPDGSTRHRVVADLAARLAEADQSLEGRRPPSPLPVTDDPEVLVAQLAVTAEDVARALEAALPAPPDAGVGRTRAPGTVRHARPARGTAAGRRGAGRPARAPVRAAGRAPRGAADGVGAGSGRGRRPRRRVHRAPGGVPAAGRRARQLSRSSTIAMP